ncbi:hypothetical protein ABZ912_55105 [Nonomuraea angiospora]|uniref:hypothetical protein n=1 Tax=Nonomuraea TaxID=83681 RepID=UPI0033B6AF03
MPETARLAGQETRSAVKSWIPLVTGVLLAAVGILWTLQGLGVVGGSVMSGNTTWAIIGPIVLVVGLVLAVIGLRRLRARP